MALRAPTLSRPLLEAALALGLTAGCIPLALALVPLHGPELRAALPPSPSAPGPLRPILPAAQPDRPIDEQLGPDYDQDGSLPAQARALASYSIHASLDTDHHLVQGSGELTWTNSSQEPVQELFVHLYPNAFKSPRTVFMSGLRTGGRGEAWLTDYGFITVEQFVVTELSPENLWPAAKSAETSNSEDETDMRLALPAPVEPGKTVHIQMKWQTKLPSLVERSGYLGSFHMVSQWFPKLARLEPDGSFAHFPFHHLSEFYADFGSYDVTLDVPERFVVGASGKCTSEQVDKGRRVLRYQQDSVHDFAFSAYDHFSALEQDYDGVRLRCLVPQGYEAVGEQELEDVRFSLAHFGARYGRYPYATLTVVHPPAGAEEAGGMEYPTLITTGGPWYSPPWLGPIRAVTVHEFGHQYFYGLVANDEHRWPFLDEGLNTFAETDALDAGWGPGSCLSMLGIRLSAKSLLRMSGLRAGHDNVIAQAADKFVTSASYGALVYGRTALLLQTLDSVYGPGTMYQALGRYARRYRYAHPGPSHLLGAVRDVLGEEAAQNLSKGLFEKGWVDYALSDLVCGPSQAPETSDTTCNLVLTRRGSLQFPVDVQLTLADGTQTTLHWEGKANQVLLPFTGPSPVLAAVVDPEHRVLIDEDFANNSIDRRGPRRSWRVLERLGFFTAATLSTVTP